MGISDLFQRKLMAVDFTAWRAKLAELDRAFKEREKVIQARWNARMHEEIARGASVSTEPPHEVTAAVNQNNREHARARQAFFAERKDAIQAGRQTLHARVEETYGPAAAAMDDLGKFEQERITLTTACGEQAQPSIADAAMSGVAFEHWRARAQRLLNPPQPPNATRREPNVLVLD